MSSSVQILKERGLEEAGYGYLSTPNNATFVSYSLNTFHSNLLSELFPKSVYSFSISRFLSCSTYFKTFCFNGHFLPITCLPISGLRLVC